VVKGRKTDPSDIVARGKAGGAEHVFAGNSGASRYMQLASIFRRRIASGEWPVGHRLPTVQQLSEHFGLAKITVRQALAVLAQDNLIISERGRGTYVRGVGAKLDPALRSAINDMSAGAEVFAIQVLEKRAGVRLPPNAEGEGQPLADYTLLRKLHLHDGEPFCLAEFYIATEVFRQFPRGAENKRKIVQLIGEFTNIEPALSHQTVTVEPADYDLARILGYAFSAPVAKIWRTVCDTKGRIVTAGSAWYRGDRFILDMVNQPGLAIPKRRTR
jgi:GntR family transcriptional regulator